ncbi:MAG: VWA domain-containing protein [Opitutaceae bacterium]
MSFSAPEWLFVLPVFAAIGWRWRGLRFHEPLRALALFLLALTLAEPRLRLASSGLDLWVLADRSDSNAVQIAKQAKEMQTILERSRGRNDRIFYIDYAGEAVRRELGDPVFEGQTYQTRTGAALQYALAQTEKGRAARILLLTDGYATEPLGAAVEQLLRSGVPLDYRIMGETAKDDWRISESNVPRRVLAGESFLLEFEISGPNEGSVPWEVLRNGAVAQSGTAALHAGVGRISLADRITAGGSVRYEARLKPATDAHPENNHGSAWVEVAGGPRVLLVTNYPDDPIAPLLESQGITVERVSDPGTLSTGRLAGARAVIFNNVPSDRLPQEFLAGLDFFIRDQGGGLLMVGGENSFGSGGYFGSALDPLLPVSMELREDQRKKKAALAITMDRSGSMSAVVASGLRKMDLANSGAARAVELLGATDQVAVHAVDTQAHAFVPLKPVGPNREQIIDETRRIQSSGGGIVIMAALSTAWNELKEAKAGTRHIIMFADANDSRQQLGDYASLIQQIRADNITISVIGMGSPFDLDAGILKEVANLGGGRMFFSADPTDLPAIFAQETVSIARSAFIREPTGTEAQPGWREITPRAPDWLKQVDGYNLSYLKAGATAALITTDEYKAPLIAAWQRGAGRAMAVSFPLGGKDSTRVRAWPGYGDFVQTMMHWLVGDDSPPGLAMRTMIEGNRLTLDLYYDESWNAKVATTPPTALIAENRLNVSATERRNLIWEKIAPGRYRATTDIGAGRMVRGAVQIGDKALPFGPIAAVGSAEWSFDRTRLAELRDLSARSGGGNRLDLAQVWTAPRPVAWWDIQIWTLLGFLGVFIVDAVLTRLGISLARK